jgi:hypothetical protein
VTDLRDWLLLTDAGWWVGTVLIFGGIAVLAWAAVRWLGQVQPAPLPRKLTHPPAAPVFPRADSDTGVIARIPGATPDQWIAQERWVAAVDDSIEELSEFTRAEAPRVIEPGPVDDCPLTTQEIPPAAEESTPFFDATVRTTDTRDLTVDIAKILEATK